MIRNDAGPSHHPVWGLPDERPRPGGLPGPLSRYSYRWHLVYCQTIAALIVSAALASPAEPWPICSSGQPSAACVVDGDTVWFHGRKVRLIATDAPETEQSRCQAERSAGLRARARLAELLGTGADVRLTGHRDRYGRALGTVAVPAGDVEAILVREGLSLPYASGSAARAARLAHWCGG